MRVETGPLRQILWPLAGVLALALMAGLWLGLRADPPSESAIISHAAAIYVAETGGAATDCHAVPTDVLGLRLLVICRAEGAVPWIYAADDWGQRVPMDSAIDAEEADT